MHCVWSENYPKQVIIYSILMMLDWGKMRNFTLIRHSFHMQKSRIMRNICRFLIQFWTKIHLVGSANYWGIILSVYTQYRLHNTSINNQKCWRVGKMSYFMWLKILKSIKFSTKQMHSKSLKSQMKIKKSVSWHHHHAVVITGQLIILHAIFRTSFKILLQAHNTAFSGSSLPTC